MKYLRSLFYNRKIMQDCRVTEVNDKEDKKLTQYFAGINFI